jgi:hypothetical protein
MIRVETNNKTRGGRLGNLLIQYSVANLFAKKHDFKIENPNDFNDFFRKFDGNRIGNNVSIINDNNILDYLSMVSVEDKYYVFDDFFQVRGILDYSKDIKDMINIKYENVDRDYFLHYRIGDLNGTNSMLPIEYYETAINLIGKEKSGYISSDTINHPNCIYLIEKYNLTPIFKSPMEIIQYGKNFKNLILSEGTFSWWIGYLSKADFIIRNKREYSWHGDIFPENWHSLSFDNK